MRQIDCYPLPSPQPVMIVDCCQLPSPRPVVRVDCYTQEGLRCNEIRQFSDSPRRAPELAPMVSSSPVVHRRLSLKGPRLVLSGLALSFGFLAAPLGASTTHADIGPCFGGCGYSVTLQGGGTPRSWTVTTTDTTSQTSDTTSQTSDTTIPQTSLAPPSN